MATGTLVGSLTWVPGVGPVGGDQKAVQFPSPGVRTNYIDLGTATYARSKKLTVICVLKVSGINEDIPLEHIENALTEDYSTGFSILTRTDHPFNPGMYSFAEISIRVVKSWLESQFSVIADISGKNAKGEMIITGRKGIFMTGPTSGGPVVLGVTFDGSGTGSGIRIYRNITRVDINPSVLATVKETLKFPTVSTGSLLAFGGGGALAHNHHGFYGTVERLDFYDIAFDLAMIKKWYIANM